MTLQKQNILTREQIAHIFNSPGLTLEQKHSIVKDQLKLLDESGQPILLSPDDDGDKLVDLVYEGYLRALKQLDVQRIISKSTKTTKPDTLNRTINAPVVMEGSKKALIIKTLEEREPMTLGELINYINDVGGYALQGRTSRTRVNNVLKELHETGKIKYDETGKIIMIMT